MRNIGHSATFIIIAVALGLTSGATSQAADKPLKVYILAGQSNMQGHADISTFDSMADDPKTAPILKEMRDADGKPRLCEKVWISSIGCMGDAYSDLREQKGQLTAGFGPSGKKIGPEFTFGIYMEKLVGEPILIIKTSWGGRSLHTDFRPPSAGPYVWSDYDLAQCKRRGDDLEKKKSEKVKATGMFYRRMIEHVQMVLKDIKRVVPEYDEKQGYELAGFVWFQGFNDLVSDWTYDKNMKPGGYDMYAELLAHLIRDVRTDLSVPKMPVVIGVMGIGGEKEGKKAQQMHFRKAQAAPASLPEFKGNVAAVETSPFWADDLDALAERRERLESKVNAEIKKGPKLTPAEKDAARKKAIAENFTPEELKLLKGVSNGGYHYLGASRIMAPIGKAFAEEMVKLQTHGKDVKSSATEPHFAELVATAERGDADAQLELGLRYRDGRGAKRDHAEALKWLRKAADKGNAAAMDAVGFQFQRGWGVKQNEDVAFGYFKAAAMAGNLAGMNNLAECYYSGLGVEQEFGKAIEHWKRAAAKGSGSASARLAIIYYSGEGSDRDAAQAEKYCRQAADAGDPDAKVLLGEILYQQQKEDAAKELWEEMAKRRNQVAIGLLKLLSWRDKKSEPGKFAYVEYQHVYQGWNNCGATSCAMLARSQGGKTTQYDIKRLCPGPIGTGTDWADLIAAAGKLGHKWKLVTFPNDDAGFAKATDMLRAELDAGRPVGIDFTMPGGAGHTLTVAGYNLSADEYVLRDPAYSSPGLRVISSKELARFWNSRYYSSVATERCRPAIVLIAK
jgi:TPR repeat protein